MMTRERREQKTCPWVAPGPVMGTTRIHLPTTRRGEPRLRYTVHRVSHLLFLCITRLAFWQVCPNTSLRRTAQFRRHVSRARGSPRGWHWHHHPAHTLHGISTRHASTCFSLLCAPGSPPRILVTHEMKSASLRGRTHSARDGGTRDRSARMPPRSIRSQK